MATIAYLLPTPQEIHEEKEFLDQQLSQIEPELLKKLAQLAAKTAENAYSPYSHFKVGAAVLSNSGKLYGGCNAEAVSYTQTTHAEEGAVRSAVIAGEARSNRTFIKALAVSGEGSAGPCGHCRQIIGEHCDNTIIVLATSKGEIRGFTTLKTLLPYAFLPGALGIK
jgi:cytidine deaminase